MFKLRIWIAILAGWLFLFYNIERLTETINIASFVYVLAPAVASVLLIFPWFSRKTRFYWFMLLTLVIYFVAKLTIAVPVAEIIWLPLTILETSSLIITLMLVRQLAEIVLNFEEMMSTLTFRQLGLPPRLYESHDSEDMYREVKRSRRFHHPLTLLIIEPDSTKNLLENNRLMQELQGLLAKRFLHGQIARSLSETLRDSDLISQYKNGFTIVLPETGIDDATEIIAFTVNNIQKRLDIGLKVGVASFPDNGITLNGLLDVALRNLEKQKEQTLNNTTGEMDTPLQTESSEHLPK